MIFKKYSKKQLNVIFIKKQNLSLQEINEVCGGVPLRATVQLSSAATEAIILLALREIDLSDPNYPISTAMLWEEMNGNPIDLSWYRVAMNTINGILDSDPKLKSTADLLLKNVSLWWNKK